MSQTLSKMLSPIKKKCTPHYVEQNTLCAMLSELSWLSFTIYGIEKGKCRSRVANTKTYRSSDSFVILETQQTEKHEEEEPIKVFKICSIQKLLNCSRSMESFLTRNAFIVNKVQGQLNNMFSSPLSPFIFKAPRLMCKDVVLHININSLY